MKKYYGVRKGNRAGIYLNCRDKVKIKFLKVKAHSGEPYNDLADELARKALDLF